ncbi:hypothetical protein NM688_g3441 [Phlebia brevispora]|uniref:Uncharacterized protein n=1 Tax=Phlebia brevispora TaxID=194682 RepID=A0ACC1T5S4_9APHY|nr:hypothetical protein NM688_g3441 [Phlebia brevispora]
MSPLNSVVNAAASAAESIVVSVLNNVRHGSLTMRTSTSTYMFPPSASAEGAARIVTPDQLTATIVVRNPNFFLRLLLSGDLGFAEAYMFGEVDITPDDLVRVFLIFIKNREAFSNLETSPLVKLLELPGRIIAKVASPLTRFIGFSTSGLANVLADARANISAHYDLGNEMFEGFLSRDMTYSCAIFPTLDGDCDMRSPPLPLRSSGSDSEDEVTTGASTPTLGSDDGDKYVKDEDELYDAQMRKIRHILRKADIHPGHRVLEIGSGWGALSLRLLQTVPGTNVDTLTLSTQQAEYVRARVEEASCELPTRPDISDHDEQERLKGKDVSLKDRLRVHLMDYRSMPPEWKGTFDRVISVEMVEAVGREYLETYFAAIDWALKKDTGVAVIQGITIPEGRYEEYVKREDFIRKWESFIYDTYLPRPSVFPGGILPTCSGLVSAITNGSKGRLVVDSISNIGPHYARTLREWRRRFEAGFGDHGVIEEALKKEHPELMSGPNGEEEIEVFRRKWIYYFVYCEAGFTARIIGDHIITFGREGNQEYSCQIMA